MSGCQGVGGSYYRADLEKYFEVVFELNNCVMSPGRRELLENCKEALEVVLDLYEVDLDGWR